MISLVDKHGVSEYSFYLQYLMQPNVISDVESIIQKALQLERISRQHLTSSYDGNYNRSNLKELPKPISPFFNYSQNPLIDSMRSNSSASFMSSQSSKLTADPSKDNEMAV